MMVKKSYYDILVYLIKNTAMKARPVAGDEHGIWQCWVPELEKIVSMDDGVVYDADIIIGAELHPDMLDRKTKYKWEITPIDNNENTLIYNNIRKYRWVKRLRG